MQFLISLSYLYGSEYRKDNPNNQNNIDGSDERVSEHDDFRIEHCYVLSIGVDQPFARFSLSILLSCVERI